MKAAIFDLDGTLCDCRHRLHHVTGAKRDWDAFFVGIPDDPVVEPVHAVLKALSRDHNILLTTGRPERCRFDTVEWLDSHAVPYDRLYMRADDDARPDHVVKTQILEGIHADGFEPFLAIDDRQSVVDLWRERGIVTLQCAPTDDIGPCTGTLTLMVGPSGAGKTLWLWSDAALDMGIKSNQVISSDQLRLELCGDFRDQTKNEQVFAAVHAMASARLRHGLNATIDATHLRRKDRLAAVALARGGPVRYLVMDRPIEEKRRDGGWRNELPIDLLAKHAQTFGSQIKDILAGDHLENVTVHDLRATAQARAA